MITSKDYYKAKSDLYLANKLIEEYELQTTEIKIDNSIEHFNRLGGTISKVKNKFVLSIPTKNKIIEYRVFEEYFYNKCTYRLICNSVTYQSINHIIKFLIDKLSTKGQI